MIQKQIRRLVPLLTMLLMLVALQGCGAKKLPSYADYIVSEEEYKGKLEGRRSISEVDVEIKFDGYALTYDTESKTYYYSMADVDSGKNPVVELGNQGYQIIIKEKDITEEIISNNEAIQFAIYNDEAFSEYYLKCTTLPILNIDFDCDIEDVTAEDNTDITLTLFDNQASKQKVITSDGHMHVRGGTTRSFPKKGYKISLTKEKNGETVNNKVNLLNLREDDDFLLYPAYNDAEKIRNVFSMNLWQTSCATDNQLQANTGMEYKYVELFFNNTYWGLYALGYPIDEKQLNMSKDATQNVLYKKMIWDSQCTNTYLECYQMKNVVQDGINDGFAWDMMLNYFSYLEEYQADSDMLFHSIDVDNAIDFMLFINMVQGFDNVIGADTKNMYLDIFRNGDYLTMLYCPWDLDYSWGNCYNGQEKNNTAEYCISYEENNIMESGGLYRIILNQDTDIEEQIEEKYAALRQGDWSDASIEAYLDCYEQQIFGSGAYERDRERWPEGSYQDEGIELDSFREFVLNRLHYLDEYYKYELE